MAQKWHRDLNGSLLITITMLISIGILFIYSASYQESANYEMRQLFWAIAGMSIFFLTPLVGYRTFLSVSYLLYVMSLILLVAIFFIGEKNYGATRWIRLGPLVVQPSEFAKLATVMAVTKLLSSNPVWEKARSTIVVSVVMILVPMILVMRQPDLGSSLLFLPILVVLLFIWGIKLRYYIIAALLGIVTAPILWFNLKTYQKNRIMVFLNPDLDPLGSGYTAIQSKIAIGSGGLTGKGFLHGTQSQLNFVPEHHTDFILCVIGEEWGFFGCLVVLFLYGFLFHTIFQIMQATTDLRAKLLGSGILILLFSQVFINVGMTVGLMPVTGLTLPLVSYGGSSLVMVLFALGLILSIHKERSIQ
jgi:rod shape determining protein RodA